MTGPCPTLALVLVSGMALAVTAGAADVTQPLFLIERTTNANVVHYDARVSDVNAGQLNPRLPVIAYWIMAAEDGRRKELNFIERTRGYGFEVRRVAADGSWIMTLVSYPRMPMHVYVRDGAAVAETVIAGHRAWIGRILIVTRKSWPLNEAVSAELFGKDIATGEPCSEKVMPGR